MDDAQVLVLDGALGERDDGRWSAFEVGVIEPRQNGKGAILEARELAGLFLFGESLIMHSAHEFKTAQEAFIRIRMLVECNRDLERHVLRIRTSHGDEGIELRDGRRLRFVARSTGSGRGFSGDVVILDEAYNLSAKSMAALLPTMSARPNPQVWYTSSAPLQTEESAVLRRFCRRGREGASTSLAYFEWCADLDDDQADPATWAKANPALGDRISVEFVENEREALGDEFARERLGIWSDDERGGDYVLPLDAWARCCDSGSGPVGPVAFALDVAPDRRTAAFAVAGAAGRGGVHVEVVDYRPGTGWLVERAKELCDRWNAPLVVAAGSPAASVIPALENVPGNMRLIEVSNADHAKACGDFYDAVAEGRLRHLGQSELDAAVAGAERKFYGDAWLWARRLSGVDIAPLVAVTLAKFAFDTLPKAAVGFVDLADYE